MDNIKKLFLAEAKRVQELIEIIDNTVVPPYDNSNGWFKGKNEEYYEKDALVRQTKSELKQRLTMLRKDAILIRKQL